MDIEDKLRRFLVGWHYNTDIVDERVGHYIAHIFHLLNEDDEEVIASYYGILGHEQMSLYDIAADRGVEPETLMRRIDSGIRRLAVSPEWQALCSPVQAGNDSRV